MASVVWAKVMWPNNFIKQGNVTNEDGYTLGTGNIKFKQTIEGNITKSQGTALKQIYQVALNNLESQYPDENNRPAEVQGDIDKLTAFIQQITDAQSNLP